MSLIPAILFLIFPGRVSSAAREALSMCAFSVIPSLFPFMAASRLAVLSGDLNEDNPVFRFVARLFNISTAGVWSVLWGLICGYPTGAKTVCDLLRQKRISEKEALKLLCFTNNAGPAFAVSVVGAGFLRSALYGFIIYISHISASLTAGLMLRNIRTEKKARPLPRNGGGICTALPDARPDAARGLLNVTGIIVFFSAFLEVLKTVIPAAVFENPLFDGIFCGIFEITSGIKLLSSAPVSLKLKLPLITFILSFSGLSVMMQSFSFAGGLNIKKAPCILCKTLSACLSAAICYFLTIAILFFASAS